MHSCINSRMEVVRMHKEKHPILKILMKTIGSHRLLSLGLLVAIIGTIMTALVPPLVLERIVNQLAGGINITFSLVVLYVVILAIAGIFDAVKEGLITVFGQKVTHRMRSEMCEKMNRLPASYYATNEEGVLTSRMVNDVDTVETLFTTGVISMIVDSCKVISILIIIWVKSKGLGVLMVLVTPILFGMTLWIQKRMLSAQIRNRVAVGKANNHLPETIHNIRMIHTFHRERYMEKKYRSYIEDGFESMEESNFYDAIYSPLIITISAVMVAVMMVCSAMGGGMQTFFGMTVGTAVAIISYVSKVFEPLESIGMEIQNIQSAIAGIYRINEFLGEEERELPQGIVSKVNDAPAIELKNVHFGYTEDQEILDGYSMVVKAGDSVTLTGRTGIGKSTVFKLIQGLYQPWSGEVLLFGNPIERIPDDERAKLMGYVEQTFHMIPGTVEEQISLKDPTITGEQVEKALELVGLKETVESMELQYDTPCSQAMFSQGQIQLLAIARAIVREPAILLLDEITANLDSSTEKKVLEAIDKASSNRTVLSISHRIKDYKQDSNSILAQER